MSESVDLKNVPMCIDEPPKDVAASSSAGGSLVSWDTVTEYIFAGNARFTLVSRKTGSRFTYRMKVRKRDVEDGLCDQSRAYFISLLRGQNNDRDYAYVGVVKWPGTLWLTSASRMGRKAPAVIALVWFLDQVKLRNTGVLDELLEVWHDGRCGRCGRSLTVPSSVERGIGPECAGLRRVA